MMRFRCRSRDLLLFLTAVIFLNFSPFARAEADLQFRFSPHTFAGDRGDEPRAQILGQAIMNWGQTEATEHPWKIRLHWESELQGRRDASFDLDRGWWETSVGDTRLVLGRVHPWDLSLHPDGVRPWGYLAQWQAQNRGILLGDGFSEGIFPQPILLGWLGAHFWNTRDTNARFQWGFSFSPLFIPTMGSEVSLPENDPMSASRFGRRSFGSVIVNGTFFPLRFRIDQSRVLQDIVLQPQIMLQVRLQPLTSAPGWQQWFSVSRAPDCDPSTQTSGFIRITGNDLAAVAEVIPRFPEQWIYSFSQKLLLGSEKKRKLQPLFIPPGTR